MARSLWLLSHVYLLWHVSPPEPSRPSTHALAVKKGPPPTHTHTHTHHHHHPHTHRPPPLTPPPTPPPPSPPHTHQNPQSPENPRTSWAKNSVAAVISFLSSVQFDAFFSSLCASSEPSRPLHLRKLVRQKSLPTHTAPVSGKPKNVFDKKQCSRNNIISLQCPIRRVFPLRTSF